MRRKTPLHFEVVTLVRDEDFDVESFIDSVIDEERTKTELKTLSRKISELGARVVQISERIEKTLNQLNERVTSLETDFEEIIEALTQFQAAALQAPKAPSMPAAGPAPTSGPTPPAISPPGGSTPSVPAPAVAAPGSSAPSVGQPGTVAPPNLTAPTGSTPPPNLATPAGASGSGGSGGSGAGTPALGGPPMGAGPGGISQSAIAEALGSLKKAPSSDEKPKPKAPVSGPNAVLSELSQVLQRRRKRSQESGDEGGGLKPVKPKVMREQGEEEEEDEDTGLKPVPKVHKDDEAAPAPKKKITSAAEMKSLLEKRLKSALSQDADDEE